MEKAQFVINNRFLVDPSLNYFKDKEANKESRLEPRLMDVLCFLAANENQLVTREKLIKEIWDDYGGADEGLNQAVSFLRKLLYDSTKEIIETIPKKGYILHALITKEIEELTPLEEIIILPRKSKKNIYWFVGLLFVALTVTFLIYTNTSKKEANGSDIMPTNQPNTNPDMLPDSGKVGSSDKQLDNKKISADTVSSDVIKK